MLAVCFDVATAFSITQGNCADPNRKCRVSGGNMAIVCFFFFSGTPFLGQPHVCGPSGSTNVCSRLPGS